MTGTSSPQNTRPTAAILADGLVRLVLAAFALASVFYLLPLPPRFAVAATEIYFPIFFQGLVLFALRHGLQRLEATVERQFWTDLTVAHGAWLAALVVRTLASSPRTSLENLAIDGFYCVYYLALVLAIERRVHRLHSWRPTTLERALVIPGATLFVLGLLVYFILVPGTDTTLYTTVLPSFALYLSLDIYVACVFLYLAFTSAAPRWRSLYFGLGLAYSAVLVIDLMETFIYSSRGTSNWDSVLDFLWNFPYVLLVVAVRRRHLRFPAPDADSVAQARVEKNLSGPSGRTMVTALTLPFLHFLCFRFGLLEGHRGLRDLVVLVWILLLATVAALQHQMLRRRTRDLEREREEFEESLRDGEQDLRLLVERSHTQQQIRTIEQKFTKAFHANPDAMALSTRDEGRVLDVNTTFLKLSGFPREKVVGQLATDIGMWQSSENRQQMLGEVERAVRIREQDILVPNPIGGTRAVRVSVEPLELDGEPCLLTVFQPPTSGGNKQAARLFHHSATAIAMLDADGRIIYWNGAAEELYGWSRAEALNQPASDLWLAVDSSATHALAEVQEHLGKAGAWRGEMVHRHRDGQRLKVDAWWSRLGENLKRRPGEVDTPDTGGNGGSGGGGGSEGGEGAGRFLLFAFPIDGPTHPAP